ncbi:MAG: 4-(cytidine 5'-diphospho)-2-C-methyl-D-erythritol kinase [Kiritimatiellae bacterium]|nr:4-(cytidine 5'-diphospho)-2-C-methyl-D-erythritol kinase [Kiritimatiellia bacterium]
MLTQEKTITIEAPAKVNLSLEVLGRRDNGYHDIRSTLLPVSLVDRITLTLTASEIVREIADDGLIDAELLKLEPPDQGLTVRAAHLLKERTGVQKGVRISIQKNIPIGGGLGGGSSDAAAVLVGLNALWNCQLERSELQELGGQLGCDVPALIQGGAVSVSGTGTEVAEIPMHGLNENASWWMVIANPNVAVSTRDIYERHGGSLTKADEAYKNILFSLKRGDVCLAASSLYNGLQTTVLGKYPLIGMILEEMTKAGALGSLVSGSGASTFGLARDESHALKIEKRLKERMDCAVWTCVARTLPDGVMVAHGPLEA